MASLKCRILGITVISAGVCAALPFRNETVNAPLETRAAAGFSGAATPRNELTLQLTIPTAPTTTNEQQPASVVADTKPLPLPQEVRRKDLQAPPAVASTFEPFVETEASPDDDVDHLVPIPAGLLNRGQ